VVFAGDVPETLADLAAHDNAVRCTVEELGHVAAKLTKEAAALSGKREKPVFMKSRTLEDGSRLVALLNMDKENGVRDLRLMVAGQYAWVERLDCETGRRILDKGAFDGEKAEITLNLLPAESRVYRLSQEKPEAEEAPETLTKVWEKEITGEFDYTLHEDNVCVLDRCQYRWNAGEWSQVQDVLRCDNAIRDMLGIERRDGEMMQTWFAEKYNNPVFGELEVRYEFFVETMPEKMTLAAERPDRCRFFLNGTPLTCPDEKDTWIDVCFKKLPIPMEAVKPGRNEITMKTTFMRTSNLEAVYLLGDFGVDVDGVKVSITTLPDKVALGDLAKQNLPFYTGPVTYYVPVEGAAEKICLQAGFTGASVRVNTGKDEPATIWWDPWQADITHAAREGCVIPVKLMPTRRDTFGPLHVNPVRFGSCGPNHFVLTDKRWTDEYALLENGIERLSIAGYEK